MSTYTEMRAYFEHDPAVKCNLLRQSMLPKINELQRTLLQTQEELPSHVTDMANIIHNSAMRSYDTISTFPEWIKYPTWDEVVRNSELQALRHELIAPIKAIYGAAQILEQQCASQLSEGGRVAVHQVAVLATDLLAILEALTSSRMRDDLV